MKYELIYTEQYNRRAAKFFKKHPDLINVYAKTLKILEVNPFHPSLRLHQLKGSLSLLHSVSINMKYRLTIDFKIKNKQIIPIDIGDHGSVY